MQYMTYVPWLLVAVAIVVDWAVSGWCVWTKLFVREPQRHAAVRGRCLSGQSSDLPVKR